MLFYDSIEKVKSVFFDFGFPQWSLYSGKGKASIPTGKTEVSNLLFAQKMDMDINDSWAVLQSKLALLASRGGYGHIYQGTGENTINIPIYFPHRDEMQQLGVYPQMGGIQPNLGQLGLPYDMATALAKERELWELQARLQRLEEGTPGGSFLERIGDTLLQSEQLPAIISGLIAAISSIGRSLPAPAAIGSQAPAERLAMNAGFESDHFRSRLSRHFSTPGEMEQALKRLADMFEANPEGMKTVLNQIMEE